MVWLKQQLEAEPDHTFYLSMHVFPGFNYMTKATQFWHLNYTNAFFEILKEHENVKLLLGAHVHRSEWRIPDKTPFMVSQSVIPVYLNNPGYTILTIEGDKIDQMIESFQLQYYMLFGEHFWIKNTPKVDLGIDLADVDTIEQDVKTAKELGFFMGY